MDISSILRRVILGTATLALTSKDDRHQDVYMIVLLRTSLRMYTSLHAVHTLQRL